MSAGLSFVLPRALEASEPPEARGEGRDDVRLLVATDDGVRHRRMAELADALEPGDLLVVNTSSTLAAAVDVRRDDGRPAVLHVGGRRDDGSWVVEVRPPGPATGPLPDVRADERLSLPGGGAVTVLEPWPPAATRATRLWRASSAGTPLSEVLRAHGRPVRYAYVRRGWPLDSYQTVFADEAADTEDGSAEMPSAGRPFTDRLVTRLVTRGVVLAPVTLHTGLSSTSDGEPPLPERFRVPATTARLVTSTRAAGGRVVAVGTTVTRALESAVHEDVDGRPRVVAAEGSTSLVLGADRPARVTTGLVTGWHAPGASHLGLLEAVAGRALVRRAYAAALQERYLWHELGDSCLLLP